MILDQREEIEKQEVALIVANKELAFQNKEKAKRVAELVMANNELQLSLQLNANKDLFISILAHNLRSPFTVLLGLSEFLIENIRKYNSKHSVNPYFKLSF